MPDAYTVTQLRSFGALRQFPNLGRSFISKTRARLRILFVLDSTDLPEAIDYPEGAFWV